MYSEKRRITPKMVVNAYRKTGLVPVKRAYYEDDGIPCACAVGVLAFSKDEEQFAFAVARRTMHSDFIDKVDGSIDDDYGNSFLQGFDDEVHTGVSDVGYEDGVAARKAVGL